MELILSLNQQEERRINIQQMSYHLWIPIYDHTIKKLSLDPPLKTSAVSQYPPTTPSFLSLLPHSFSCLFLISPFPTISPSSNSYYIMLTLLQLSPYHTYFAFRCISLK